MCGRLDDGFGRVNQARNAFMRLCDPIGRTRDRIVDLTQRGRKVGQSAVHTCGLFRDPLGLPVRGRDSRFDPHKCRVCISVSR